MSLVGNYRHTVHVNSWCHVCVWWYDMSITLTFNLPLGLLVHHLLVTQHILGMSNTLTRCFSHWTVSLSPGLLVVGGEAWGEVPGGDRLGLHWACIGLAASVLTPPPLLAITWSTVTGTSCTTTPSRFLLWSPEGWGSVLSTGGACVGSGDGDNRDAGGGTAGNSWFMKPGKNCSILIQVVCSRFKDASFCGPYKTET